MIRECNLSFVENAILTKEMLIQMNQEPKWLFLTDNFRNVNRGIISGFEFINSKIDDFSIMTKGNIIIDGKWYRMEEDYKFNNDELESGKFYKIILYKSAAKTYEVKVIEDAADKKMNESDVYIGRFKYEYEGYNRVFRVPGKLSELCMKKALLHDVKISYYNNYGVAVCPPHIAVCIVNSLREKEKRSFKEEIIFQRLINEKTIAIESLLDLIGMSGKDDFIEDDIIERLQKIISGEYEDYGLLDVKEKDSFVFVSEVQTKSNNGRNSKKGHF